MNPLTRKLYLCQALEGDKGPSVESDIVDERIAARRLRIETRIAQKQPGYFEHRPDDNNDDAVLPQLGRQQIELSMQRIINICRNGNSFITNIKVACDARENLRRLEEEDLQFLRKEKIEIESNNSRRIFEELQSRWASSKLLVIPQQLHDLLEEQKKDCAEMIDNKNRLIHEIHLELKAKDDHFVKELKKRSEDVGITVERMESQMKSMQKAYTFELREIEKAFLQERENLFELQTKDWDDFLEEIRKKQVEYLQLRRERIEVMEGLITQLRTKHCEELNALKFKLHGDVQQMETDLQQMKAAFQLNLEKLEYNFQVLKRRDEENSMTKSHQKRKITRLQDHLNHLRIRARKQEEQLLTENEQLSEDYKKRMEMFRELQKKSKFLIDVEKRNFREIWTMNEDELRKEAYRLLDADRVIYEQQLGLPYVKPDISFLESSGNRPNRTRADLSSTLAGLTMKMSKRTESRNGILDQMQLEELPTSLRQVPPEIVQKFVNMLCFEPEFLIEEKMKRLLQPMPEEDKKLIRLDAVLNALEIHNEDQLDKLFTYFLLPYEYVEVEEKHVVTHDSDAHPESRNQESAKNADGFDNGTQTANGRSNSRNNLNIPNIDVGFHNEIAEVEFENNHADMKNKAAPIIARTIKKVPVMCLIDPVDVVAAIKLFANDFCAGKGTLNFSKSARNSIHIQKEQLLECRFESDAHNSKPIRINRPNSTIGDRNDFPNAQFWETYLEVIIPEDKQKLYDALLKSLIHYREILKGRSKLIIDNEALRQQNCELKHMLDEYLKSKVNKQLEVPPVMTMKTLWR